MTRFITILTTKEMADTLSISENTLIDYVQKSSRHYDPDFPVVKVGKVHRFVKEIVEEYFEYKKKQDIVEYLKYTQKELITSVSLQSHTVSGLWRNTLKS